jgi:pSer/pThr/pTyr-binding forkhead associated (FHA) protein/tetratricopeptide (TPR) repeat protein
MSGVTKTTPSKVSGDTPYLEQTAGTGWGRTFELSRKKLSIGRTTDNEIVLDSTSVSRVHAVLKQTAKGWFIEDNISKNGIWVNGIAIKKALLRPGDVVQIGEFVFRYCDPRMPSPMSHPEEVSRSSETPNQKTEVISTDTWNVGAESMPQKPPLEAPPTAPGPTSASQATSQSQSPASAPAPTTTQQPSAPQPQTPSYTPPAPTQGRPRVHPPVQPIHLATFGKNHQEKLYLAMGLLGGLLVGTLLYMRTQKPSTPTPIVKNRTSDIESPRSSQDAFREIADTTMTAEELEDGLPQYQRQKSAEQAAPAKPAKPRTPEAQAILQANEEAKKPKIRPEELQLGVRSKKNRAASKDIGIYLEEGKSFLKDGDYESAALAFRFALVIDPNNSTAKAGIASATSKRKHVDEGAVAKSKEPKPKPKAEPKVDKQLEKRAAVIKLLKTALESLKKRRYQDAIVNAEKARQIEIPGETAYLNEAKQIIDRSERRQKEEFEPFIDLAREKMAEGDYRGSILLCEEMLRTDPGYAPAKECMERSTAGLAASVGTTKPEGVK